VSNALELLDHELQSRADEIDSVHLCFTTDPFMYDCQQQQPLADIASLSMAIIRRLNASSIPVTTLTKGVYPEELIASVARLHRDNQYGISLVSLSETYRQQWEPGAASAASRIDSLAQIAAQGARTWVSIEPYPTPNIDPTAPHVTTLLEKVSFADKIVFGRWNYNGLATAYDREHSFYAEVAPRVVDWCARHDTGLHIKRGTPLSADSGHLFLADVPVRDAT
jgi:DNA repair photolyase